jgi:glycosidase
MSKLARKPIAVLTALALTAGLLMLSSSVSGAATIDLGTSSVANQALAASAASTAPIWMKNAVIYQVNTRQYSASGTFDAVTADLGRLQKLGVDILWLMPIHPIGEVGRKGSMGSPYSVADYYGVNPDLGTEADLRELIDGAHAKGMKVILDWVANHSSFDNPWITDHKDWYTQDGQGNVVPPNADWTDVADLNFDVPAMRAGMIDALKYWVSEFGVDGYRCDVAWGVPVDFWNDATAALKQIKPVYMLAEADGNPALLQEAFLSDYGWKFKDLLMDFGLGIAGKSDFAGYMGQQALNYPTNTYPMLFVTNHDENSWTGSLKENFGSGAKTLAVLTFTVPGIPLIFNGQEVDSNKRLAFFEKDQIDWMFTSTRSKTAVAHYTKLVALKTKNQALWNGAAGGKYTRFKNDSDKLISFEREKNGNKVIVVLNPSPRATTGTVEFGTQTKTFFKFSNGAKTKLGKTQKFSMKAWGYEIYSTVKP